MLACVCVCDTVSYTIVRVFFSFFLWGYGRATHSHIDGPKNVKLPKLVSFIIFSREKRKEKRRIELSRFSLLFSLFHDMIFLVLWLFAVDSSQKMSYVPSPLFIYICDVHFSSIWPTHRYVIISSCSFLSVLHHQHQPKSILAFVCVITSSNVVVIISLTASKLSPFWKVDKWENFHFFFFF